MSTVSAGSETAFGCVGCDPCCPAFSGDDPSGAVASDEPDAPPEPLVSAYAIGIEAIAAPTPSVIAKAPTRPT